MPRPSFGLPHLCIDSHLCRCICAMTAICAVASVHRQPFVPLHLCIDSHLCRCIMQRLCVAVFMHPCITALCGCLYASLHNGFVRPPSCILCTFMNALLVSHHCLVSRLGCHICASTAICAVASCNGFVWLSLCILA